MTPQECTFSIVIPAYNCENTIHDTIKSILRQSYPAFELIVVNDGSRDGTKAILERYEIEDERVKIYSIDNSGPANARNVGIEHATSAFLMFVDSDDTLMDGALQWLANEIITHSADIYMFGHVIVDIAGTPVSKYHYRDMYGATRTILKDELWGLYRANLLHQLWNKVYSMRFIHETGIRLQDYRYGEDRLFVFDVLKHSETVYIMDRCLYRYRNDPGGSLITNYYSKKFQCCCEIDTQIRLLAGEIGCDGSKADPVWNYMFLKSVISCLINFNHHTCDLDKKAKRQRIREILNHPQTRRPMRLNKAAGLDAYFMNIIIRSRIVWLNVLAAKYITRVMQKDLKRFVRTKHQKESTSV